MTENTKSRVVVLGGTGFLGQAVARQLGQAGYDLTVVSRHRPAAECAGAWVAWDGRTLGPWADALEGAIAVVNLVGRTVDCRKTPDRCDEILRSRVDSVRVLGEVISQCARPPAIWVQASTAHIYGDPPDSVCDEHAATGFGLAPFVGKAWEHALALACPTDIRSIVLRTSFVLGRTGGAYPVLRRLARLGLGGRIGSGKQWISWLHVQDFVGIVQRAIEDDTMKGIYNVTAPQAVTNAQFMRTLRRAFRIPLGFPSPGWVVRLGTATFLDTDPELPLYGRNVVPARLLAEGYRFTFADLADAVQDLG